MSDQDISVIITAYNEEKNIQAAIESAFLLTNKVTIIDTDSTDKTKKIALDLGCQIYSFPHSIYVEPVREFAVHHAQTPWVFILDADERIEKSLAQEILLKIKDDKVTHYKVKRKNFFAGKKWLKYGGWYPDYVIRLIHKNFFIEWPSEIHSTPKITGKMGFLENNLIHFFHPNLENMVSKTAIFENIESDLLYDAHRQADTKIFFRKFLGEFNRRMLQHQGFRDGLYGIIESLYQSFSKTITYLMLYEKYQKSSSL